MSNPDFQAMNEQMVQRLLSAEPDPIPDGGYGLRVVEVTGRTSGQPRRTPIGLLRVDDVDHLVCPDRTRDWAANLTEAGHCAVLAGTQRTEYDAAELHGLAAARVVSAYLSVVTVPWARNAFGVAPEAGPEQIEPEVGRMAVFALTPVSA